MKPSTILLSFAATALAAPFVDKANLRRDDTQVTDELLFNKTLFEFSARRNKKDPASLDWTSDGCTNAPNNPFQFPFVPACNRHDFGYQNYRAQKRFTKENKAIIDKIFLKDLVFQCEGVWAKNPCKALALVYYAAVTKFGGQDAQKRDDLDLDYEEALRRYEEEVRKAQEEGLLPDLD